MADWLPRGGWIGALTVVSAIQASGQDPRAVPGPVLGVTGTVRFHRGVPSRVVTPRNVEVWLPPDYDHRPRARYPVVYIQDGQNVFSPATAYVGVDWGVDETMTRLVEARRIRPAIVVAVWNTRARNQEYLPRRALGSETDIRVGAGSGTSEGPLLADRYLEFLVGELKPFIDSAYRTLVGPADTFVMGSSLGGLIAVYAVTEYPRVFGGAACLSTHWPAGNGAVVEYLRQALPAPGMHRFYFDHGTLTLDSLYPPFQRRVDDIMRSTGYVFGRNWVTRRVSGADHSERAWRVRVAEPLGFLLGPASSARTR